MAVSTAGPYEAAAPEPRPRSSPWVFQVTALSLVLGGFLGLALQSQRSIREAQLPGNRFSTLVPYSEALATSGADRSRPQRVIDNSAARCAGASIRVNDALLSGAFTLWAIGNPANLESALKRQGGLVEKLMREPLGMITIERRSDIKI